MRFAVLAIFLFFTDPAQAGAGAREIVCYAGSTEIFRGKNDPRQDVIYRGSAVTFVDAADGRWKTFPSCSMVWEIKP